jgi:hypothetical protein
LAGKRSLKSYSNAGQGVYTIVNKDELEAFMQEDFDASDSSYNL